MADDEDDTPKSADDGGDGHQYGLSKHEDRRLAAGHVALTLEEILQSLTLHCEELMVSEQVGPNERRLFQRRLARGFTAMRRTIEE